MSHLLIHSLITVVNAPHPAELDRLGVQGWLIRDCQPSSFPWSDGKGETCLLLEGDVTVMPEGGKPVCFGAGDQVNFAAGLSCHWHVHQRVRKRYNFKPISAQRFTDPMAALALCADQIAALPQTLFAWSLVAGKLHRELRFADLVEAFGFMARVALLAAAASGCAQACQWRINSRR